MVRIDRSHLQTALLLSHNQMTMTVKRIRLCMNKRGCRYFTKQEMVSLNKLKRASLLQHRGFDPEYSLRYAYVDTEQKCILLKYYERKLKHEA